MAKNKFSPKQARAKARAAPRDSAHGTKAGYAGPTTYGKGGAGRGKASKGMFKPGLRTGATGPESGRHRTRSWS